MNAIMPRASTLLKASIAAGAAVATGLLLSQCGSPKKEAYGFDVALTFTPAATAKLKALGKPAVVDAFYYGLPTPATAGKVDEDGHITLGQNFTTADGQNQTVSLTGNAVDPAMLDKIKDKAVSVTVRAYLDPTAGVANVLNCSQFDGPLTNAQTKAVTISCDVAK